MIDFDKWTKRLKFLRSKTEKNRLYKTIQKAIDELSSTPSQPQEEHSK